MSCRYNTHTHTHTQVRSRVDVQHSETVAREGGPAGLSCRPVGPTADNGAISLIAVACGEHYGVCSSAGAARKKKAIAHDIHPGCCV